MNPLIINIFNNCLKDNKVKQSTGRPPVDCHTEILKSIFYKIQSCCTWQNVKIYGKYSYNTVYKYFKIWSNDNIFAKVYKKVLQVYSRSLKIKWKNLSVDSSMIRSLKGGQCIGNNYQDRNRKAVKLNTIVDSNGVPLSIHLSPANEHDIRHIGNLLDKFIIKRPIYNQYFLADKGYDSDNLRTILRNKQFIPIIPYRGNRILLTVLERNLYNKRKIVENHFSLLKQYKGIRQRYERLISHFTSFIHIANSNIVANKL